MAEIRRLEQISNKAIFVAFVILFLYGHHMLL